MQPRSQCARDSLPQAEDKQEMHPGTGHRARLRERLLCGGAEALADYEVLEYLLFAGIRQGDTKPLAKSLLARFGSLAGVLNAHPDAFHQVNARPEERRVGQE